MAARRTSSTSSQTESRGFTTALASAVLEWLLIFLLYIHAIFSYLITQFACYFELQVPCILCSRLDHVMGNEKPGFYWDLICGNHKLEISSLVLCHGHNKLADVHNICESCLFSFATINKSNAETYRLLVGKMGEDPDDHKSGSSSTRLCSCCNESWITKGNAQKLLQPRSVGSEVPELDVALSGAEHDQNYLKRRRDIPTGSAGAAQLGNNGSDPLSHVGYMELKITSDTESEVPVSDDDDDSSALVHEIIDPKEDTAVECIQLQPRDVTLADEFYLEKLVDPKEDIAVECIQMQPRNVTLADEFASEKLIDLKEDRAVECIHMQPHNVTLADEFASEKLIDPASENEPSLFVSKVHSDVMEAHVGTSVAPTLSIGHGLEELNWQQAEHKADLSPVTKVISFDVVPPSSTSAETLVQVTKPSLYVAESDDVEQICLPESGDISKAGNGPIKTTEMGLEMKSETGFQMPAYLDLGDAYKIAVGNKGRQLSGKQLSIKESTRVSEDLKLLLSQISATRGIELSMPDISPRVYPDMSPRVYGNNEDLKIADASSSAGIQILQKRISLERNVSGFESLDGSIVSEIEGESVLGRLKRQIEHDRILLGGLYKELEEERNASAVAANQAMAMITRLQEEKAALHMEALQYLRMMEEQSEYDMEALQKSNDLLAEKEKEIQDLEAEVETYRIEFPNKSMSEIVELTGDSKAKDVIAEQSEASCVDDSASVARNLVTEKPIIHRKNEGTDVSFEDKSKSILNKSLFEFEDERLYISECLKKLEERVHLFSNNGVYSDLDNGEYWGNEGHRTSDLDASNHEGLSQKNNETKENGCKGIVRAQEEIPLFENPQSVSKENNEVDSGKPISSVVSGENDSGDLGSVVSDLNNRLEALEADRDFLECIINSLRNRDEGLEFIQEIACHLRELRRIGVRRKDVDDS